MPVGTCERCGWTALGKTLCSACETVAAPLAATLAVRNAELSGAAREALRALARGEVGAAQQLLEAVVDPPLTTRVCQRCGRNWRHNGGGNPKMCRDCRRWLHAPRTTR